MMKKMANTLTRRHFTGGEAGKIVKYTPCSRQDSRQADEEEDLEEIAVVSNADPGAVKYGSGSLTANGPRVVPGIITSCDRTRLLGERLSTSGTRLNLPSPSPVYLGKTSDEALLDVVGGGGPPGGDHHRIPPPPPPPRKRFSRGGGGDIPSTTAYVNRAHVSSELDISHRHPVRGTDDSHVPSASASSVVVGGGIGRRDMRTKLEKWETASTGVGGGVGGVGLGTTSERVSMLGSGGGGCKWTFVFDPSGRLCYYWSMVVSVAFLYNFWVLVYRFAFQEITEASLLAWFCLDYLADLLYVLDIVFHFRTGYLEDGVLQTDSTRLRQHYMNTTTFYIDCLCLLPLDFLYLSIGFNSILRCFRLVKIYRFWAFLDRTERHTNYPNVFRACSLIHYLLVIFHWNACLYHIISRNRGFGSQNWVYPDADTGDVVRQYLHSFYWSTLSLSTIGDLPRPRTKGEYLFVIVELVFGLLLFATVLGHVANIVTNVSAARKEFQAKLDGVKTYMRMRRVPAPIQAKVIKWFDYLWMTQKSSDEEKSVGCLPDKLKAEIAIHVHLDTLRRVEIFQNTEAGFLCELVLRLRPVLFSPGDYICRKGEVGKEMYIVNRGRLQVVADNGKTVLATLKAGSYFGEISILNMGTAGNRRTASVRSVGYSDLFCLSKQDMWDVLKEYPAARVRLEAIAVKRLEKYRKAPLEKIAIGRSLLSPPWRRASRSFLVPSFRQPTDSDLDMAAAQAVAMGRSHSTPGLVESKGRIPIEDMYVSTMAPGAAEDSPPPSTATSLSAIDDERHHLHHQHRTLPLPPIRYPSLAPNLLAAASYRVDSSPDDRLLSLPGTLPSPNPLDASPGTDSTALSPSSGDHVLAATTAAAAVVPPYVAPADQALLAEIKRLRERLASLESENASLSLKLSEQQWHVEHRLADIELQIRGGSSVGSAASTDDNERNRESII